MKMQLLSGVLVLGLVSANSLGAAAQNAPMMDAGVATGKPMSYTIVNATKVPIKLATTGKCGSYLQPMKPGARLAAECAQADGPATIGATTSSNKPICAAHIMRKNGVDSMTFDTPSSVCRANQGLNHVELVVQQAPGGAVSVKR